MHTPPGRTINRVGFFHFADADKSAPADSLAISLRHAEEEYGDLSDALIVLPEAFNIRNDYFEVSDPDVSVEEALAETSKQLGITFVAGLVGQPFGPARGNSYACLIHNGMRETLSCKTELETSRNYAPCPEVCDKVVFHRGICIAALVCYDATEEPSGRTADWDAKRQRHKTLLEQIEACSDKGRAVLCIPGRMTTLGSEAVAQYWTHLASTIVVIVANTTATHPSIIRYGETEISKEKFGNCVRLHSLDIDASIIRA